MPYVANDALPAGVRAHLPCAAQSIYREAFNRVWYLYDGRSDREQIAHRLAWAAVKRKYIKVNDHWAPLNEAVR